MGTLNQTFWPYTVNWDGTDPAGGDVLKADTAINSTLLTANQSVDFGTSGAKTITVDPNTTGRTTTGVDPNLGWAINISGATGMDSTAAARRFIPAGTWSFQGTIGTLTPSLNGCQVTVYVYRVAASPSTTRTLLFSAGVSAGLVGTATNWAVTSASQPQIVLEAGETIQVTYTLGCTGQVGGLVISLQMGDSLTNNDLLFQVPSPGIRTLRTETHSLVGVGLLTLGAKTVQFARTAVGVGTITVARSLVAAKTSSLVGKGVVSRTVQTTKKAVDLLGRGTTTGRIELPIDEVPEGGGGGTTIIRPLFMFDD